MRALAVLLLLACTSPAGEVLVRVTFGDDPIEGAGVQALKADEDIVFDAIAWTPAALTDEAGEAVLDVPKGGRVLVAMAGYALAIVPADAAALDVALRPELVFTGTVTDVDGKPVAGASVKLRTQVNRDATFPARTDGRGRFVVFGLWFDNYELDIEADGFVDYSGWALTERESGETVVLHHPVTLGGIALDGDDRPAAGVTVATREGIVTTGDDGTFSFESLRPGRYTVCVHGPFAAELLEVTLRDGETRDDLTLFVKRPARLRWRTVDAEGKPLEKVEVSYDGQAGELDVDDEGRQVLDVLPGEPGKLTVDAKGFERVALAVDATGPGGVRDLGDVVLPRTAMVEVVVLLPNGLRAQQGGVADQQLKDGSATVPQGTVAAVVPGFVPVYVEVRPPGPVTVTLPEPVWLSGLVLSPHGEPVANQLVTSMGAKTQTDAEGRFRVGPLPDRPLTVRAARPPWAEIRMEVAPGEGELVLRFERDTSRRLLRGVVLEGERPVRRFSVNGTPFVDEEGAFELLVDADRPVAVFVGREYLFPLPPPDEPLIARLPEGRARVTLEGGVFGVTVRLRTLTDRPLASARTDETGIAHFDGLPPGRCIAVAEDYRPAEVEIVDGEPPLVVLTAEPAGVLRVRLPGGVEETDKADPTDHLAQVASDWAHVEARVEPGTEVLIDLAPADAGRLVFRGARDVRLVGRVGGAEVIWWLDEGPLAPLPPGRYILDAGLARREFDVAPGETVEIDLAPGVHAVAGTVLRADGAPAQGAMVMLARPGDEDFRLPVNPRGEFRFPEVPEGVFECWAELGWLRSGVARIVVGAEGVTAEGLPLVVRPPSDARIRLVGPGGAPLPEAWVRIDGHDVLTDREGGVGLPGPEATLDLDLAGFASVRGRTVRDGETVELARGATLVVLFGDLARERLEIRIGGRAWAPLEPDPFPRPDVAGRLRLDDLPAGEVEIEVLPDPEAAPVPAEGEEGAETAPPEPEITRVRLRPGMVTTVDVGP